MSEEFIPYKPLVLNKQLPRPATKEEVKVLSDRVKVLEKEIKLLKKLEADQKALLERLKRIERKPPTKG
jgi:cell division protein FtsB